MFGHDDSNTHQDENTQPTHDGVLGDASAHDETAQDNASPAFISTPPVPQAVTPEVPTSAPVVTDAGSDDLLDIKQSALKQLSPLVGHLDQTPEEKFRTTMMLIQASDNQSLIKDAYASAQQIADEKTKAQALLDIVNEINYFTSQKG